MGALSRSFAVATHQHQLCPALRDEFLWVPAALIPRLWSPPILVHPVHHFFDHLVSRDVVRRLIDYAALVFSWRSKEIEQRFLRTIGREKIVVPAVEH